MGDVNFVISISTINQRGENVLEGTAKDIAIKGRYRTS